MSYKSLLSYLLTLVVGISMTACPDSECDSDLGGTEVAGAAADGGAEDCEEGGSMGGNMGGMMGGVMGGMMGGMAGAEEPVYSVIVILDETTDLNNDGTPGVDICEVEVDCPDETTLLSETNVQADLVNSDECDGSNGMNCVCVDPVQPTCGSGINRNDADNATDGTYCEEDGDNYVTLGKDGTLTLEYDRSVLGCTLKVFEKGGVNTESYAVYVCPEGYAGLSDCVMIDGFTSSNTEISEESFPLSISEE